MYLMHLQFGSVHLSMECFSEKKRSILYTELIRHYLDWLRLCLCVDASLIICDFLHGWRGCQATYRYSGFYMFVAGKHWRRVSARMSIITNILRIVGRLKRDFFFVLYKSHHKYVMIQNTQQMCDIGQVCGSFKYPLDELMYGSHTCLA